MARVKRGTLKNKRKKKILKLAKGFRGARSTKYKQAKQGVIRAGQHAYAHRRKKKRVMRKHWQILIGAAVKNLQGISYSQFMDKVTKAGISVDRKIMAHMIQDNPESFARLVETVTGEKNTGEIPTVVVASPAPKTEEKEVKKTVKKEAPKKEAKKETEANSDTADDLTKIEGIGPKIAETLKAAGVSTFAELASAKTEDVQAMIADVRGNHDAGTWAQQATLAADGKWDELQALQDELDGGRVS